MDDEDFDSLADYAPDENYNLSGVIAFYQHSETEEGAFATFLTGDIPEDPKDLAGMQALVMNVQAMIDEYLDSSVH